MSKMAQGLAMSLLISLSLPLCVLAQNQSISANRAQAQAPSIRISPGRATAIVFRNGERIS